MDKILKSLKEKYLKSKEFKKQFDRDREKAIEKYFGKKFLEQLKVNIEKFPKSTVNSFLNSKEELDDIALEGIAGGKEEERVKEEIIEIRVPKIVKEEYKVNMTPIVKGNLNVTKGSFSDF